MSVKLAATNLPFRFIPKYLSRPKSILSGYDRSQLRPDLIAGLTIAVILLPQAIAYALIAELPPQMGIYTAIVTAVVGALWGSSNHAHTGPTNAVSLLVLSTLIVYYSPGSPEFIFAAGMLAIMAGVFQLGLGLARLGMILTFVSHSVVVGFAAGAGILIAIRQIAPLLGLQISAQSILDAMVGIINSLPEIQVQTALLGISTILLILVLRKINPRIPSALIAMITSSIVVYAFGLDEKGVAVIGELPKGLPPLTDFSTFSWSSISSLFAGALAVGIIGLVEKMSISRTIAAQTSQRLDNNQEFVGQGLANIVAGLFSGYACSGSLVRSTVNYNTGGRSSIAAASSGAFVLISMFFLAPMTAYLPRTALAAVLIVTSISMINLPEITRIWRGTRSDAIIMLVTFLATILLNLALAVFLGVVLSLGHYILRTSMPRVHQVLPDETFKHFIHKPDQTGCPQLGIIDILGNLYFGAVNHVEEAIEAHQARNPDQRYLLIRMHHVNHCDFSGIHMLESIVQQYRERGGDVFMVHVGYQVDRLMDSTGFYDWLTRQNILPDDEAINHLFYKYLDPAVCIYECPHRVFLECQNLPKRLDLVGDSLHLEGVVSPVDQVTPQVLWAEMHTDQPSIIVDVREPREYKAGHIPGAISIPMPEILREPSKIDFAQRVIFVCRSGRRSTRVAGMLVDQGANRVSVLKGGMLAWEAANLLEAVDLNQFVQEAKKV